MVYFLPLLVGFVSLVQAFGDNGVRVEFKLLDYTNDGGVKASGVTCGGNGCDPVFLGYVDIDKALNAWPGSNTDTRAWAQIYQGRGTNQAALNKIVSRDICDGFNGFNRANLRIQVQDANKFLSGISEIQEFECLSGSARDVDVSEDKSRWSDLKQCDGKFNPNRVRLTYVWRAFRVLSRECGKPPVSSSSNSFNPSSNFNSGSQFTTSTSSSTTQKTGGILAFFKNLG